ncbi:MAG: GGDEF domain-containing protein [Sporomusaceae bacterium]|nr:GGDEF domain-containing protein [Sporomusaceae bacterium]
MRDMNWMARQIEMRERDLRQAADDLWKSRNHMDEQNKMLLSVNAELLAVQEILKERTIQLESSCSRMEVMAMTDPLTEIANRRCFFETLERQFTERVCNRCPISLLIIDIDFFKTINDTYGHQAGDTVLLELARIIQDNAREEDLAARIGGEEYAILLPGTLLEQAVSVANRIQTGIGKHKFLLGEDQVSVTASIGICTLSQALCCFDREKIVNYADQALYHSKHNGRNSISVYDPDTHLITKVA